jgi:NADH dehydrogenase
MILVAGSTGALGFEVCRRLRGRGQPVRALVRATSNAEKVSTLRALGCDPVVGDMRDRRSLDAVCRGADVVMSTVTAITSAQPGETFDTTDRDGTINLIDAAAESGVKQFIFVSFDCDALPDSPLVRAKQAAEQRLRQSGVAYTILHSSLFMESWLGPMLFADTAAATAKVYGGRDGRFRYITVGDVAEVTVQCVGHAAAHNAVISVAGPESLTQREAVERFENAFGKPFAVMEVPEPALEEQWKSAADPFTRSFTGLMLGVARGWVGGNRPNAEQFSIRMTTVDEFATALRNG